MFRAPSGERPEGPDWRGLPTGWEGTKVRGVAPWAAGAKIISVRRTAGFFSAGRKEHEGGVRLHPPL